MKDQENIVEEWDKKRLSIGGFIIVAGLVGILFYTHIITLNNNHLAFHSPIVTKPLDTTATRNVVINTKGIQSAMQGGQSQISSQIKQGVQNNMQTIKQEVQNLNMNDLATSSPQIKKIITDVKSLEQYPKSQVKDACERICSGL